jgi:hypothetical protein
MEPTRKRRLSRWMPAAAERTISPRAFRIGCAALSGLAAVALYFSTELRFALPLVVLVMAVGAAFRQRRLRRLAADRQGESICTFARALDPRELHDVARDIAERTGRRLEGAERNPVRPVATVGDLVRFFAHQPRAS